MEHRIEDEPEQRPKGTPLRAVMDENCTSCAGSPPTKKNPSGRAVIRSTDTLALNPVIEN
jgi:hypothetical protein